MVTTVLVNIYECVRFCVCEAVAPPAAPASKSFGEKCFWVFCLLLSGLEVSERVGGQTEAEHVGFCLFCIFTCRRMRAASRPLQEPLVLFC